MKRNKYVKRGRKIKHAKYVRKGRKKGLVSLGQEVKGAYQEARGAAQAVTDAGEKSEAESMVTIMDTAYTGVKMYAQWQRFKLKAGIKPGVMLGKGYYKAIKRIRTAKRKMELMEAATSVVIECPYKVARGPSARLSEKTKQNLQEIRRREASTPVEPVLTSAPTASVRAELIRLPEPIIRNARDYDISVLEERNGISSGRKLYVSSRTSAEDLEQKNKVCSREEEHRKSHTPREREQLQGAEKTEHIADKNKVRSKRQKDNLRKKKKKSKSKSKSSGTGKAALKREMKYFVAKQIFTEGEDSGAGELVKNVGMPMLLDKMQKLGKASLKLLFKLIKKLLVGLLIVLGNLILALLVCALPILVPLLLLLSGVVVIVVAAAMIVGLFVSPVDATRDDFAVTVIKNHQAEVLEKALDYEDKWYNWNRVEEVNISYKGISNIASNSDDILLVYFAKATKENKFDEDTSQAPLLNVNSITEKWVMNDVLDEMLYIDSVTYSLRTRTVVITVTPTPMPTDMPEPTLIVIPDSEFTQTPPEIPENVNAEITDAPEESDEEAAEAESGENSMTPTPVPSPTPTPEPERIEIVETYYVADVVIAGKSAEEWTTDNLTDKEQSIYSFLLEMFKSFGYTEKGGDAVCQKYSEASLE